MNSPINGIDRRSSAASSTHSSQQNHTSFSPEMSPANQTMCQLPHPNAQSPHFSAQSPAVQQQQQQQGPPFMPVRHSLPLALPLAPAHKESPRNLSIPGVPVCKLPTPVLSEDNVQVSVMLLCNYALLRVALSGRHTGMGEGGCGCVKRAKTSLSTRNVLLIFGPLIKISFFAGGIFLILIGWVVWPRGAREGGPARSATPTLLHQHIPTAACRAYAPSGTLTSGPRRHHSTGSSPALMRSSQD